MAVTAIDTIKSWFETGDKPTQDQFWAWLDSYFHKSETIGYDNLSTEVKNLLNAAGNYFVVAVEATQITLPAGMYDKIIILDVVGTEFTIGTTDGGDEILETNAINAQGFFSLVQDLKFDAEQIIYINGATETAIIKVRKS